MRTTLFKTAALAIGLFGVVQPTEAQEQTQVELRGGVRTSGALTQSFEFTDNQNLTGGGGSFKSLTGLDFSLSSRTALSTVSATTGATVRFGKGGFSLTRPKLTLGFETNTKRVKYNGRVSYLKAPLGIRGTLIDFDPTSASLVPSTDFGLTGKLSYRLNRRTSYSLNGALGSFEADSATSTESLSASLDGQVTHQLNSSSQFDGNLGFAFIDTSDTVGTATTSAFSVSLLFGAGLTQTLPDGSMAISLNQEVNPSASGALALGTRLNGSFTKNVNSNESYKIGASLGRQEDIGGGTVTTFINVAPSYTRQLTRDVSATASYFVQRDDAGSTAQGLTLSFTRPFDFPLR